MRVLMLHEDKRDSEEGTGGGAESMRHDLCLALSRLGHEVRVWKGETPLYEALETFAPDVVHVSTLHNFIGLKPLEMLQNENVPHVLALMDYWPFCGSRMLLHGGDRSCPAVRGVCDNSCGQYAGPKFLDLVNASPVVALNQHTADIYRRNGLSVFAVAEIGVDTDRFRPDPQARTPEPTLYTHSAWADYPTKGMHILAEALAETPYEAHLMTGLPRETVATELRKAHVHVFPSCYEETWGLCLTEAMASGCACIASDVAGPRAQIEEGVTGLLVPPRDPLALRAAIENVMGDPGLRLQLGVAARHWVVKHASLDAMGRRWENVYAGAREAV